MENNLENKSKFFALYWGFKCLRNELLNDNIPALKVDISNCKGLPQQYLELTPLSQISDEDAIEVYKIFLGYDCNSSSENMIFYGKAFIKKYDTDNRSVELNHSYLEIIDSIDYLRSRGYALPWMGLSVEQLVEYGWVKLNKG